MRGRWNDALENQVALIKWWRSDVGKTYGKTFLKDFSEKRELPKKGLFSDGEQFADGQAFYLDRAETFWTSPDMCMLVEHAQESMPPQQLHEHDMPTRTGFAWLEKTHHTTDVRGDRIGVKAFMWHPQAVILDGHNGNEPLMGVLLEFYGDRDDPEDDSLRKLREDIHDDERYRRMVPRLSLWHLSPWTFDTDWVGHAEANLPGHVTDLRRYVAAWWTLVQQPLTFKAQGPLDRATRRRIERSGILTKQPEIKVITLRKHRDRPDRELTDEDVDDAGLSHRFMVDGHWRAQWYPSKNEHRQIWISPYIKGPEDRPLILRDRVYKWSR